MNNYQVKKAKPIFSLHGKSHSTAKERKIYCPAFPDCPDKPNKDVKECRICPFFKK